MSKFNEILRIDDDDDNALFPYIHEGMPRIGTILAPKTMSANRWRQIAAEYIAKIHEFQRLLKWLPVRDSAKAARQYLERQ